MLNKEAVWGGVWVKSTTIRIVGFIPSSGRAPEQTLLLCDSVSLSTASSASKASSIPDFSKQGGKKKKKIFWLYWCCQHEKKEIVKVGDKVWFCSQIPPVAV